MTESKLPDFNAAFSREQDPIILSFISMAFKSLITNRFFKISAKQYVPPFRFHATVSQIQITMKCVFVWNISTFYFKLMSNFDVFMRFNEVKTSEVQFSLYCVLYARMFMNSICQPISPQFNNRVVWNRLITVTKLTK